MLESAKNFSSTTAVNNTYKLKQNFSFLKFPKILSSSPYKILLNLFREYIPFRVFAIETVSIFVSSFYSWNSQRKFKTTFFHKKPETSPVESGGQWSDLLAINHSRLFGIVTLMGCILWNNWVSRNIFIYLAKIGCF